MFLGAISSFQNNQVLAIKLDMMPLQIMGSSEERKKLLDFLHPALANEIEKLKPLMEV